MSHDCTWCHGTGTKKSSFLQTHTKLFIVDALIEFLPFIAVIFLLLIGALFGYVGFSGTNARNFMIGFVAVIFGLVYLLFKKRTGPCPRCKGRGFVE